MHHLAALVLGRSLVVGAHGVGEYVHPGEIGGAEGGGGGPRQSLPRDGIDVLHAQAVALHGVSGVDGREDEDAVGDEVGGVLAPHHPFAETLLGEPLEVEENGLIGVGAGHQLEQVHVPRRIEEMRAEETGAHVRR